MPAWKQGPVDIDFANDDQLQHLEQKLDAALDMQDFKRASTLRDRLFRLQSGAYVAVLSANFKFYQAFDKASIVDMAGCWLQDSGATCKHPIGPLQVGYVNVLNGFGYLFSLGVPSVKPRNVVITVRGSVAWVTCEEHSGVYEGDEEVESEYGGTAPVVMAATNIYAKRNGQWYICHHSAQPIYTEH